MSYIFLSHCNKDEKIAREIKNKGKIMGIDMYMYQDDPRPGGNLPCKLTNKIKKSNAVIAIITENSMESDSVKQEIGVAIGSNKLVIPFVQKGIDIKSLVFLQGIEYIIFDPNDSDLGMKSINNYLENRLSDKFSNSSEIVDNNSEESNMGSMLMMILLALIVAFSLDD